MKVELMFLERPLGNSAVGVPWLGLCISLLSLGKKCGEARKTSHRGASGRLLKDDRALQNECSCDREEGFRDIGVAASKGLDEPWWRLERGPAEQKETRMTL